MSKYVINGETLTGIADAIRTKTNTSDSYKPTEMAAAIESIATGGGDLPEEALNITGDCRNRFAYNGWNWFIDNYGNQITTSEITLTSYMFYYSDTLTKIPFDINLSVSATDISKMFAYCKAIAEVPYLIGNFTGSSVVSGLQMGHLFSTCSILKTIPDDFFWKIGDQSFWDAQKNMSGSVPGIFTSCYSLRTLPDISMLGNGSTSFSGCLYYSFLSNCYSLDSCTLPVVLKNYTSNVFRSTVSGCFRLKDMLFAKNEDGTPITASWKSQTVELTQYVGYTNASSYLTSIGFTEDTRVTDATTYAALKDNPDYWTTDITYSRYNKTSALATIDSLPDTSAAGGVNTIKFMGNSGANTDGGAINTMTEEEIAVAAAKGWTVAIS